jgi:meso-butanediol dehydrogenase / (S,S)-butanediol dehydrogenase / diacetyl reductase
MAATLKDSSLNPNKAPPGKLEGKVVLITGGTSGIGEATARLFANEGASVAFTGRRVEKGRRVKAEIIASGGKALYIKADHTRERDCQKAVQTVIERFDRLDVLFNNAGVVLHGNAEQTSLADWQLTLDLNVTAVWRMSRLVIPLMRAQGGGVIINNASDWGMVGAPGALAYCMSKGAVIQITRAMALDHARENIRVNAVCPGDTLVERWLENGYFKGSGAVEREQALRESGEALPIGRVATVEEIARAVLFLAGSDSSYMTGSILVVDGGNTAR